MADGEETDMAITQDEYLLLQDLHNAQTWMLLRSREQFHLVRVNAALTERKYERLMKRYPCTVQQMQELGLSVTALNREACTHVTLEGMGNGDKLILYCSGSVREFTLGDSYSRERLEGFFDAQQVRWDLPEVPPGPTAQVTKVLGWILNGLTSVLMLLPLFGRGFPGEWVRWLALAAFLAAVGACILWPGRFLAEERRGHRKPRVIRASMVLPVCALPLAMTLDVLENVTYRNGLGLFLWGAVLGAAIGAVILWRSREYRSGGIGLLVVLMTVSGGVAAQVNQLLDFGPTTVYRAVVEETEESWGLRSGRQYDCHVTLPDGTGEQFSISRTCYEDLAPGDCVSVVVHEGALGLEYLTLDWEK